jgi:hypothetical protein
MFDQLPSTALLDDRLNERRAAAFTTGVHDEPTVAHAEDDHLSYASDDDDRDGAPPGTQSPLPPPDAPPGLQPPLSPSHGIEADDPIHDNGNQINLRSVPTIPWNENTLQDVEMSKLGIAIQTDLHVVTCVTCECVVDPSTLRQHISKHIPKRLIPKDYCDELQQNFSLTPKKDLLIPGTVRPAIPNLPLHRSLFHCPECGYAAFDKGTVQKHTACGEIEPKLGYAQAYFPKEKHGRFFAVTVPEPSPPAPGLKLLENLRKEYPDPIPCERPTAVPKDACDANPFLAKEGWGTVASGLTGTEMWEAVRTRNPILRKLVAPSVEKYMSTVNGKLTEVGMHPKGVAIGSYHGWV